MQPSPNSSIPNVRQFRVPYSPVTTAVRRALQLNLSIHEEIVVDCFAGGGGASSGTEEALGRRVDVAINHNPVALSMHQANHPETKHYCEDVRDVDPRKVADGRSVGYLHLSPDCTHHSQAAGGQPRNKEIRGLSWQAIKWGGTVAPRVITLENVTQIRKWGPLIAKRDKVTGRVLKLDDSVAIPGERVPLEQQFLIPDPKRAGQTWRRFVRDLRELGYTVEDQTLCAADYGAPTTRERLFMVARRDGRPIVWPKPTHAKNPGPGQKKWRAAAECIDWSIPCPSIFLSKEEGRGLGIKRPLADATLKRIAKGIKRYVIDAASPFIVPVTHQGGDRVHDINDPMRTVTGANRGELALSDPIIVPIAHYNGRDTAHSSQEPLRTITAATKGGEFALATPILAKFRGQSIGSSIEDPIPTITSGGACKRPAGAAHALGLITPILVQAPHGEGRPDGVKRWGSGAKEATDPLGTITGSGGHATAVATLVQTGYGERKAEYFCLACGTHFQGTNVSYQSPACTGCGETDPVRLERAGQAPRALDIEAPLGTIVGTGKHSISTAYLAQMNGGFNTTPGHEVDRPMTTITNSGSQQQVVTANLVTLRNNCVGHGVDEPVATITAGAEHHAVVSAFLSSYYTDESNRCRDMGAPAATITTENRLGFVECTLAPETEERALRVAAFMIKYYGEGGQMNGADEPLPTISTKDRLALVTVVIKGTPYVIVDIGLRMLAPRELYLAQGFRPDYIIDRGHDGRVFSKSAQVHMCGNSVSPVLQQAIVTANCPDLAIRRAA